MKKAEKTKKRKNVQLVAIIVLLLLYVFSGNSTKTNDSIESVPQTSEISASDIEISSSTDSEEATLASEANSAVLLSSSTESTEYVATDNLDKFDLKSVPSFSGEAYVAVNGNKPFFDTEQLTSVSTEYYSPLDSYGRCGMTYACVGQDIMPTEERGSIGMVQPTGWHTVKYDCVDGSYLYNRCHLIGYQLSGENANVQNLITGTRYLNIQGMLPFENMVADYVKETGNHVAYRVTPIFDGTNLLANGVLMEGYSIEDDGDGICYCVFAYNSQPGVVIDYATGDSELEKQSVTPTTVTNSYSETSPTQATESTKASISYVLNTNTKKFHYPSCSSVKQMKESNKQYFEGDRDDVIARGYVPCKKCNP